ncbi:ABC transporter permease [Kitasatospora brasiliensis]|uniref:ABC transporter permease n=1 Tax=Kitasatospora brasiliensis TaxID=3058040 RepID=UPI00292E188A|nr:ABC transporter permease subunit [Kitasatospora sp. K002]
MNPTVARLTLRGLLGRRRGLLLLVAPALLLAVAALASASSADAHETADRVLGALGLGTLVPILGLVVGTGVIATEIDDGSIVYLLAKPLPRWRIITTKLAVAIGVTWLFSVVPTLLAGLLLVGTQDGVALGYAVAVLVAGAAYSALFLLLGVVTRHAVVAGLAYALIWESTVGNFVQGARTLSVQQWGRAVGEAVAGQNSISADVSLAAAVPLLLVVTVAATVFASVKLAGLTLAGEE